MISYAYVFKRQVSFCWSLRRTLGLPFSGIHWFIVGCYAVLYIYIYGTGRSLSYDDTYEFSVLWGRKILEQVFLKATNFLGEKVFIVWTIQLIDNILLPQVYIHSYPLSI